MHVCGGPESRFLEIFTSSRTAKSVEENSCASNTFSGCSMKGSQAPTILGFLLLCSSMILPQVVRPVVWMKVVVLKKCSLHIAVPPPPPPQLFLQRCSMGLLLPSCFSEEEGRNSERALLWVIRAHSVMRVALRPTVLFNKLHVNVFVTSCLHSAVCKIELCKNYFEEAPTSGGVCIPCIYSYAR